MAAKQSHFLTTITYAQCCQAELFKVLKGVLSEVSKDVDPEIFLWQQNGVSQHSDLEATTIKKVISHYYSFLKV